MPEEAATARDSLIETTVDGRYLIVARIASGGMGEVFRAHDPVLNREVALKMLHQTLAGDEDFIDRFRREARAAAMLSHPNIVAVHDWGRAGDTYFMVMEYVRGPNLRTLLTGNGPFQPAQSAEVISQVLDALGRAHEEGIVHRDIKPENVLVTTEGVVKVADFGLARALAESRVTQSPGTVTGTVQYLAPEQIEGHLADPRTDLYATGIVLYELLVGRVPFSGETSVAIAYKHLRDPIPPPSRSSPMVPDSLDGIVARATEKDRDQRFPDAGTMRRELAGATADLPPAAPLAELAGSVPASEEVPPDRARTVTIPRAVSPRTRRRRVLGYLLGALSVLVLLAAAGWATWTYLIPHPTGVPTVEGLTVAQGQQRAEAAGLTLVVERQEFSSDVPAGRIISQRPPPDEEVERGSEIQVILSLGPQLVEVPPVIDLPLARARSLLRQAGLEREVVRQFHPEVPEGTVFDQNPSAGTPIEVGRTVTLTVSRGPQPVEVPGVVGRTREAAEAVLRGEGLEPSVTEEFSNDVQRGRVAGQNPAAGTGVAPGSTVQIVVSLGPQRFAMPDVVGMNEGPARSRLNGLGLEVRVVQLPAGGNRVVGQDPPPGETVEAGEEVTIYVGG
jgi:eukaryotic-like serine/threonine-protein kinase